MEDESSHYSSSYSVGSTDFETGEDVKLYLSDQYQTMDSWDDSEDDSRTIYYDSDDVKNALENDYTDWESLLWQLQLQEKVKDVIQDILPEHFVFAQYAINNMEISNLADIDDLCELLEQSIVDGDTDRIDCYIE
jgi:hypothetical protein